MLQIMIGGKGVITMKMITEKNEEGQKVIKLFNDDGQLVEEQVFKNILGLFFKKIEIPDERTNYYYDLNGNITEKHFHLGGKFWWQKKIFYNSKWLRTREVTTSNNGEKSYRKFK